LARLAGGLAEEALLEVMVRPSADLRKKKPDEAEPGSGEGKGKLLLLFFFFLLLRSAPGVIRAEKRLGGKRRARGKQLVRLHARLAVGRTGEGGEGMATGRGGGEGIRTFLSAPNGANWLVWVHTP
jgi:hypothetical protein